MAHDARSVASTFVSVWVLGIYSMIFEAFNSSQEQPVWLALAFIDEKVVCIGRGGQKKVAKRVAATEGLRRLK